jgi:PAS domain S-box-containing protein
MKTLVVSRDSAARMFIEDVLRSFGYTAEILRDAEEAWASYQREAPALAIVDLTLPQQAGLELCRRMRASAQGPSGIILALAAGSRTSDLQAAVDAGVDDYVWRPIDGQIVRLRLTVAAQRLLVRNERTRAEHQLREREERYRTLFEALPDAIFLESLDGRILDCNQAACDLYGFTKQDWVGKNLKDVLPSDVRCIIPALIGEELSKGGVFHRVRNRRKDGSEFPCQVTTRLVTIGGDRQAVVLVRECSSQAEKAVGG